MSKSVLEIVLNVVDKCKSSCDYIYFQNYHLGFDLMSKLDILLNIFKWEYDLVVNQGMNSL